jgi:hypothetical protein
MLLSLMYALTVNNTLTMINCETGYISVSRYSELDQSGFALASAGIPVNDITSIRLCELDPRGQGCDALLSWSQTHLNVRILSANPSFVCYEGTHLGIVWFVYITLLVYVIGYPVGSYMYIRRRIRAIMLESASAGEWTDAEVADRARRMRYVQDAPNALIRVIRYLRAVVFRTGSRYQGRVYGCQGACTTSCCFLGSRRSAIDTRAEVDFDGLTDKAVSVRTAAEILNDAMVITDDIAISPFTADVYRASIFYQRHVDFACLFVLSVLLVFVQEHPRIQLGVTLAVLALHTGFVLIGRPYTAEASFNHVVRVCANILAMMGAIASFLSYTQTGSGGPVIAASHALGPFSYVMLVFCIGLALLFVASFFFTLVKGAKLDQEQALKRMEARRILVPRMSAAAGGASKSGLFQQVPHPTSQERNKRVHHMGLDSNFEPNPLRGPGRGGVDAAKGAGHGSRIVVPENDHSTQWGPRYDKSRPFNPGQNGGEWDEWDSYGLEAHVNPLFITEETAVVHPQHATTHRVSDW